MWDGRSPQTFSGYPVSNFGGEQFGRIDLVEATAHSVNTVYVPLGIQVGFRKTMDTSHRLGLPDDTSCEDHRDATLYLGTCEIRPADEAAAFATFAAKGKAAGWHLVSEVRDRKKKKTYAASGDTSQAIAEGVNADAVYAMRAVIDRGTARGAGIGRPAAGKTGTTSDNTNAWFSGFVPQLATTVWMGYESAPDNGSGKPGIPPLRNLHGYREVTGGTLPAKIWRAFMTAALQGVPVEDFPVPSFGGTAATPSVSATPTSASPTPTPSASVSVTVAPPATPTGLPTLVPSGSSSPSSAPPTSAPPSGSTTPSAAPSAAATGPP
jgi:membrane peptidoglycan carboxypeptidase